jgi:hypothetical protein
LRRAWKQSKDVEKVLMKRLITIAVFKICAEAILITILAGVLIGIIGNLNKWETPIKYSDAFFFAGCLVIIAGFSSQLGAGQEWNTFQRIYAESFRDMSPSERANYIVNENKPIRLVILSSLSGILLILISTFVWYYFG